MQFQELEIEQAEADGNQGLVEELKDALYVLQRVNAEKIDSIITGYQPEPFNRAWGTDPDYAQLVKEISTIAEKYNDPDYELKEKKKKKKKKKDQNVEQNES